jgi:hypothetical protein
MDTKEDQKNVSMDTKGVKKVNGILKGRWLQAVSLKWRPILNYLGLMLATRVGPRLGQEPVATPPERSEPSDFFLCILLLIATISGWWLREVLGFKLQCFRERSLNMLVRDWSDFSRSFRRFKKMVSFLLTGVHHGWTCASAEGAEGMTML